MSQSLMDYVYLIPAILLALTFHEVAHGYVSHRLGDPTPLTEGRLSLNPLRHLDPVGTLMLIFFKFGWAKPVIINPAYYRNPKRGMAMVAAAGPLANFVLALIAFFFMAVIQKTAGVQVGQIFYATFRFLYIFAIINVGLGMFNLIPVPPLDGSKVFGAFLSDRAYFRFTQWSTYGMLIVLALVFLGVLNKPLFLMRNGIMDGMIWLADKMTFFLNAGAL